MQLGARYACSAAGQCGGCFPGDAMSILLGGAHVRMDELKTGDKVLTVDAKGRPAYDEVCMCVCVCVCVCALH